MSVDHPRPITPHAGADCNRPACVGPLPTPDPAAFTVQVDGLSPYTANLCRLPGGVELAGFREDFGESIGELIETVFRRAVWQRATEHLDGVLSEQERVNDTVQTAAR